MDETEEQEEPVMRELTGELTFEGDFIDEQWEEGYDY
jgi:hypothetical protein